MWREQDVRRWQTAEGMEDSPEHPSRPMGGCSDTLCPLMADIFPLTARVNSSLLQDFYLKVRRTMSHKAFANLPVNGMPKPPASKDEYESNSSTKFNALLRIVQHHYGRAGVNPLELDVDEDGAPLDLEHPNNLRPSNIVPIRNGQWTYVTQRAAEQIELAGRSGTDFPQGQSSTQSAAQISTCTPASASSSASTEAPRVATNADAPDGHLDKIVVFSTFSSHFEYIRTVSYPCSMPSSALTKQWHADAEFLPLRVSLY